MEDSGAVAEANNLGSAGPKKKGQLDLSRLDQKSVKIMVMLMLYLLNQDMTTQEFFQDVIFEQNVKTKTKHFTMIFLKSEDFFRVLKEKGIRGKDTEHENLRQFLQLNDENPNLLLLKNIKKTLEQMAENEPFMQAIQEDVMQHEQEEAEQDDLDRDEDGGRGKLLEDQREKVSDDDEYEEDQKKLDTVREGNETNAVSTNDKKLVSSSANGLAALRDVDELDGSNKDSDDDYDDDKDHAEKDDYEF